MNDNIKIYLICGKARTGKNTVGSFIKAELEKTDHKVCEIQIMRTLKGYLKDYFNWNGKEETKPRELLQRMGTELIRGEMNMPLFHIDRLTEDIKVLSNFYDVFIVDDIRLKNEIMEIRKRFKNVKVILVEKENIDNGLTFEQQNHSTERDLEDFSDYDCKIINSDDIKLLHDEVSKLILGGI